LSPNPESFGARGYRIEAADELSLALKTLAQDTVTVVSCPVDYGANLILTEAFGELDDTLS
jgi:acetolactate synthase-1/2/3 large subunit